MLIREVTDVNYQKLVALGQFLIGRAGDTNSKKTISVDAFINMAHNMGINITAEQLRDLATQDPLKNTIVNVTDDQVVFSGAGEDAGISNTMTVDQAEKTVDKMAKRALNR